MNEYLGQSTSLSTKALTRCRPISCTALLQVISLLGPSYCELQVVYLTVDTWGAHELLGTVNVYIEKRIYQLCIASYLLVIEIACYLFEAHTPPTRTHT